MRTVLEEKPRDKRKGNGVREKEKIRLEQKEEEKERNKRKKKRNETERFLSDVASTNNRIPTLQSKIISYPNNNFE